jgi:hypothetical protein
MRVVSAGPPVATRMAEGSRYLLTSETITEEQCAEISEGLRWTAFPAAMAAKSGSKIHRNGKFHGPMMRAIPRGSLRTCALLRVPAYLSVLIFSLRCVAL